MINRAYKQIEFIKEIDKMKNIYRMTLVGDGSRRENDAEHSWHLAIMAMLLEEYAIEPVDISRVMKMTLVHDLVEIYAGDTFAYDVEGNKDKEARENAAAAKLFSQLPEDQEEMVLDLWHEFDAMETKESKYANAMDRLQPFLSNCMTDGHTWKQGNVDRDHILKRMDPIRTATPELWPFILATVDEMENKGSIRKKVSILSR